MNFMRLWASCFLSFYVFFVCVHNDAFMIKHDLSSKHDIKIDILLHKDETAVRMHNIKIVIQKPNIIKRVLLEYYVCLEEG